MSQILEIEVVINREHGLFGIDEEMATWLIQERGWQVTDDPKCPQSGKTLLRSSPDSYYSPQFDDFSFRTNRDLVECVKALHQKYAHFDWWKKRKLLNKVLNLRIVVVSVFGEIQCGNGGIENVHVSHTAEVG